MPDNKVFFDSNGLIDTIVTDCNSVLKLLMDNKYIGFCAKMVEIVQKLTKLQEGIKADLASKDEIIADLKRMNDDLAEKAYGMPVDRGNGNEEA